MQSQVIAVDWFKVTPRLHCSFSKMIYEYFYHEEVAACCFLSRSLSILQVLYHRGSTTSTCSAARVPTMPLRCFVKTRRSLRWLGLDKIQRTMFFESWILSRARMIRQPQYRPVSLHIEEYEAFYAQHCVIQLSPVRQWPLKVAGP